MPIGTLHKTSTLKGDLKSAFSEHIVENPNHKVDWNGVKLITTNKHRLFIRKYHEAIMIKRIKPILNRDMGLTLHTAYDPLI